MKMNEKLKKILMEKIAENDFSRYNDSSQAEIEYRILERTTQDLNFINFGAICDNLKDIPEFRIRKLLQEYTIVFQSRPFKINLKSLDWVRNVARLLEAYLSYNENQKEKPNICITRLIFTMYNNRTMNRYKLFSFHLFLHQLKESFNDSEYALVKKALKFGKYGFWKFVLIELLQNLQTLYPELNAFKQNEQELEIDNEQELKDEVVGETYIDESDTELKEIISNPNRIRELYLELEKTKQDLMNSRELADYYDLQLKEKTKDLDVRINQIREEIKINFFKTLNSVKSGQLLDNFYQIKHKLAKLKSQGWKPDKDTIQLEAIIHIFENFLKSQQITPIYKLDEIIDLPYSMLPQVNYRGEPFDENEIQKVSVKTPGWRFNEIIISKPDVIQYKEEDNNVK